MTQCRNATPPVLSGESRSIDDPLKDEDIRRSDHVRQIPQLSLRQWRRHRVLPERSPVGPKECTEPIRLEFAVLLPFPFRAEVHDGKGDIETSCVYS